MNDITMPFIPGDIVVPGQLCGYFDDEERPAVVLLVTNVYCDIGNTWRFHFFSLSHFEPYSNDGRKSWRCEEFTKVGHIAEEKVQIIWEYIICSKKKWDDEKTAKYKQLQAEIEHSDTVAKFFIKLFIDSIHSGKDEGAKIKQKCIVLLTLLLIMIGFIWWLASYYHVR